MEDVVANQVEFVRTLCLTGNRNAAKQWAGLSVMERGDVIRAMKNDFEDDIDRLTDTSPWCVQLIDDLESLLSTPPKLVVVKLPAKKPVYELEQKPGKKPLTVIFRKRFDDAHGVARDKTTRLAKLLFFKAVRQFGHLNVEYVTRFSKRRSNDAYGNPRTTRAKVRIINAIRDVSLSRKFYAAGPAVWEEADLTVIFARTFPSAPETDVVLYKIGQSSGVYKVRRHHGRKRKHSDAPRQ